MLSQKWLDMTTEIALAQAGRAQEKDSAFYLPAYPHAHPSPLLQLGALA